MTRDDHVCSGVSPEHGADESQPVFLDLAYDDAFELLDRIARGIAHTVGPGCETLVQRLEGGALVVASLYNGHVSGRCHGSTLSIYGGETGTAEQVAVHEQDDSVVHNPFPATCVNALVTMPDGRRIKSSSWGVTGPGYTLYLGMNIDITSLEAASSLLAGMASTGDELLERLDEPAPAQDVEGLFDSHLARLGKPVELLSRAERISLVHELREAGFFEYQRSVPLCARKLGVSKASIYNYLRCPG